MEAPAPDPGQGPGLLNNGKPSTEDEASLEIEELLNSIINQLDEETFFKVSGVTLELGNPAAIPGALDKLRLAEEDRAAHLTRENAHGKDCQATYDLITHTQRAAIKDPAKTPVKALYLNSRNFGNPAAIPWAANPCSVASTLRGPPMPP